MEANHVSTAHIPIAKPVARRLLKRTAPSEKVYLYAIIAGQQDQAYEQFGIDRRRLYTIGAGLVAAVVSDLPDDNVRPERSRLAAHHEALKRLMAETTPLPMSFGVVAGSAVAVRKMLARNQQVLLDQLRHVADKVEMGLRVAWDVPNIFEYFVNTHPELRMARDQFFGSQSEPTQEQKIELGRMFDRLLQEDRETYTDLAVRMFTSHGCEIKRLKCRNEREVMNLAGLVRRDALPQFEADVFEVAKQFDNNFALDYNGPWAPHNFVDVDLEL
jgi:Gas vesicle synthesis protein GvpL/GvpF